MKTFFCIALCFVTLTSFSQTNYFKSDKKVRAYRITGGALGVPDALGEYQFEPIQKFNLWMYVEDTAITINNVSNSRYTLERNYIDDKSDNGTVIRT